MKIKIVKWMIENGWNSLAEKLFKGTYNIQLANSLIGSANITLKKPLC